MRKLLIDLLPRASKLFRRDFKQPRRLRLKHRCLRNIFFDTFISFYLHSISSTNYTKNGLVGAP